MAKAKKQKAAVNEDTIVMDVMPGADLKTEEEVEPFLVDLNFEGESAVEEKEEVEFPKEAEAEVEVEVEPEVEAKVEEPEVEAKAEEAEPKVEEEKLKSLMVPKSRLDEVLAKNKKMQKQLQAIEEKNAEQEAEAPKYDFETREQEYQQLILDGESSKAVKLRGEMREAEKAQFMFEVQKQMGHTVEQNQAAQALAAKAVEIQETFPVLDENSSDFNEDLAKEVLELRDAFIIQGYEPSDSLARATEYTLSAKMPELLKSEGSKKVVAEKKQKITVKNKIEAAKAQPPVLKGESTSQREDKSTDITILSDDEFSALPEDTLRRLRGDFG